MSDKEYQRAYQKRYLKTERGKRTSKNKQLKYHFGISIDDYELMLKTQNNKCAICKKENMSEGKNLCVDHNHTNGKIRGLLCASCNRALGLLGDDPETLLIAFNYLIKHAS